jgi:hypothetical protein
MKKLFLSFALLSLLVGGARASVILGTGNPPGTPLTMSAGTTSGLMSVTVVSDNSPNDVMAAWQFQLEILPEGSGAGTLTFQDPATGAAPNPTNYIFANGLGIATTNTGSALSANDFDLNGGTAVAGGAGANLLQMDFLASSDASGLFGVYAVRGVANTEWTDSNANTQFFSNVPDGTGAVLIGEVDVTPAGGLPTAPEPNSLTLLGTCATILVSWGWWRKRKQAAALPDQ